MESNGKSELYSGENFYVHCSLFKIVDIKSVYFRSKSPLKIIERAVIST
ncbi:hypothetical protein ADICYQ_2683 [Cyclobacterium qasimii M12-11B]|uniref:Uncharacterized protein n=1 Tax=Cyclobacterium qasimii M12-11B TaxID=641524 RepID=S7WW28_9BACT|nr:hypothetical protein ADICYQ_2683 [Cyclobacterium qasimii M12-11B]